MTENNTTMDDEFLKAEEEREERRRRMLANLLSESFQKKGYVFALRSKMGRTLIDTGTPRETPSYTVVHTLDWIGKNLELGTAMPFMKNKIDQKTGRLIVDEENAEELKQRAPDWTRQPALTAYLAQPGRKFGPIIAVINPSWIDDPNHENWTSDGRAVRDAVEFEAMDIEGKAGLIRIGTSVYALDGQHRVIGIRGLQEVQYGSVGLVIRNRDGQPTKKSYSQEQFLEMFDVQIEDLSAVLDDAIPVEYIPAVIKGETRQEASRRIRSIFIAINSYAKRTDKGENILLDEADGYSIVARKAGVFHKIFNDTSKNNRVNWKNTSIPKARTEWYTTLQAIRDMAEGYLPAIDGERSKRWDVSFKGQMPIRPSQEEIESARTEFSTFLDRMIELPVFRDLESGERAKRAEDLEATREFPKLDKNGRKVEKTADYRGHLLLRPIGQVILARATGDLLKKGMSLDDIFDKVSEIDSNGGFEAHRHETVWYGVTYDPDKNKMITTSGNQVLAQRLLVYLVNGMATDERLQLWRDFVDTRVLDRKDGTWRNFDGDPVKFDYKKVEFPAPV